MSPMFSSRYRLCDLFGIPIYVSTSFLVLLVLFILNFGSLTYGLSTALVLALSVTAHELAHALTARAFGYRTTDITLSLLGGCASMISLPRKASQEFKTALAGPLMSFALAGAAWLLLRFGFHLNSVYLWNVLDSAFWINIMLGGFNLLPGFPMDGGRIFRSAMLVFMSRAKATHVAMWVGRICAILIALRGLSSILNGGSFGFISLLIAWMIWKEGYREYCLARTEENFRRWTQDDFNARVSPPPYER